MKRIVALTLAIMMTITCCFGTASAAGIGDIGTRASFTISSYNVGLKAGTNSGELRISYDVTASKLADSIGVSSIVIYNSNGSRVLTVTGTVTNGLIITSDASHTGVYTYKGTSGISYYAEVTVFATVGTVSDSRTVTTSTVKAP